MSMAVTEHPGFTLADAWQRLGVTMGTVANNRSLIWELAKRELRERHAGSLLGSTWIVLLPLAQLAIYAVVFTQIFKVKLGGTADMPLGYTTYLFAGLLPWLAIADGLIRNSISMTANANLVKQVVFPIELLPLKSSIAAVTLQVVSTGIAMVFILLNEHTLPLTVALLPVAIALELGMLVGVGWILAVIGVFVRDLKEIIQVALGILVYCIPAFYTAEAVPGALRIPVLLNPFTHIIYVFQDVMYYGRIGHPLSWVIAAGITATALLVGNSFFQRCKPHLGSML